MNTRDQFWFGMWGIILAIVLGFGTATVQASPVVGSIIYVDTDATGVNNGTSWADAFKTLQPALDAAVSGDQIWVAEGTYFPTYQYNPDPRSACFQLKNGVAIYGGFAGSETALEQREWMDNPTNLSGDRGIVGDASDNSYHVFYHPEALALDSSTILDGFIITGGNANSYDNPHGYGGGMYNRYSSLTLINITFVNNSASLGGGIYNSSSSPTLINVTFVGNSAQAGGGMENMGSNPTLINVTFSGNSSSSVGGGLYNGISSPTMTNVTFSGNTAVYSGGGMYNSTDSYPTLTNITLSGNSAGDLGGGIYNESSIPTLTNAILWGNTPDQISGETALVTYSDIQGGYPGTGNIDLDPRFIRLPSPGGDGTWGTPDDDYGDLRLRLSPASDAGNNTAVPPGITTDLLGQPRFVDVLAILDTGLGTPPIVDMGAYEAQYNYVFLPLVLVTD